MMDWPIGLSTGCFYKDNILDVLEDIRNGGFSLIEICSFSEHLDYHNMNKVTDASNEINKLGLEPFSFHAPFKENVDITSLNKSERDYSAQEIIQAVEAAAALKVKYFVLHPGPEKADKTLVEEHLKRLKNAAEVIKTISEKCYEHRMNLVLENMLPHLMFGNISDVLWIMGELTLKNIGICLDTGHANLSGDIDNVIFKVSGHLKMIHANDNNGKEDEHLPLDNGIINWEHVFNELITYKFHGTIILELSGDLYEDQKKILLEARESRHHIRKLSNNNL